jgi:hypothetical protein
MKKIFALWLTCLMSFTITNGLIGAETTPSTTPGSTGKAVPAQLEGKIVALDKSARLMTVDINGTLIKIRMTVNVKLTKKGKPAMFENLAPGQSILISFVEMPNGRIEVASLTLEPTGEAVEAAGPKPGSTKEVHPGTAYWGNAPYGLPNPANISGQVNSGHK